MSLLMPQRPIVINPDLAYSIGLNEAIVLQQVNYWLKDTTSGHERNGVRWIYNTTEQWLEQFPFWSESTLKRTFTRLKTLGVLKIEQLNKSQRDMTNYYTINYASDLLDEVNVSESKKSKCTISSGQNEPMEQVIVKRSIGSERAAVIRSNWHDVLTENTTEITTEITGKDSCPVAAQPDVTDSAKLVLEHFNQVTKSSYRDGKTTMGYIRGRLADGYAVTDLIRVTDYTNAKWADDAKMSDYLRPKTLFGPENFQIYYQSALKWEAAGRPACVNGRWVKNTDITVSNFTTSKEKAMRQQESADACEEAYSRFLKGQEPAHSSEMAVWVQAEKLGIREIEKADPSAADIAWVQVWITNGGSHDHHA